MGRFREISDLPTWRKVALHAWGAPRDPTAYGTLDLDVERALAWLEQLRAASGEKITLTHVVGKAISMAIAERPETNAFVSRGRLMQRPTIDIFFQVAHFDGEKNGAETKKKANLAGAKIREVDRKSVVEIARELRERAERIRTAGDAPTQKTAQMMARLPGPLVGVATRLGSMLSYDFGLDLSKLGIPFDPFGTCMVTNVGVFGIPVGYAPLLEMSRAPLCVTLGAVHEAPSVRDGKLVVAKKVTLGVAFDHRVMDGFHAGVMARRFSEIIEDPAKHLSSAEGGRRPEGQLRSAG
jgi:pyruvate dehydrogenase E2 component (dihydrolipoamide acetyltransferase)